MADKQASRTAVLVCQGRAAGNGRMAPERFGDDVAAHLLLPDERALVDRVRAGDPPADWRDRMAYELLAATAAVLVPRTVAIDDAVRAQGNSQLVILGAGLDGRAWRMADLAGVDVFEVDHPASQQNKRERVGELAPVAKSVTYVPVDFGRDTLATALAQAGFRTAEPATWIWEGVLPYLTRVETERTLDAVADLSAPGSRLIATYPTPNRAARLGRLALRVFSKVAGRQDPLRHERHVSAWTVEQMRALLVARGFRVTSDEHLLTVARELSLEIRQSRMYGLGRVVIADKPDLRAE
ncbi:class I SAM-dependent methyltransferase [Nocardia blacklockiae]|uniref:class I SAM-dependent methyltransferase n=1 Tax=Nocardia blacklockiae TaxID=480036 RepID=UPI002B4AB136|nr:class I SAM-dependent methyltransferase [Nocardia blacklockiae]